MPRKNRKIQQKRPRIALDESMVTLFLYGLCDRGTSGWDLRVSRFFDQGRGLKAAWAQHEAFLMAKWHTEKNDDEPFITKYFRHEINFPYEKNHPLNPTNSVGLE